MVLRQSENYVKRITPLFVYLYTDFQEIGEL